MRALIAIAITKMPTPLSVPYLLNLKVAKTFLMSLFSVYSQATGLVASTEPHKAEIQVNSTIITSCNYSARRL